MLKYVSEKVLPDDSVIAKKIVSQAHKGYYAVDGVLYHEDASCTCATQGLENHDAPYAGHFAPKKMYDKVRQYYYWPGMKRDIYHKCSNCITCASVQGEDTHCHLRAFLLDSNSHA